MPLVLVVGRPCTGKTTTTKLLQEVFEQAGCEVLIVSELSCQLDKNEAHKGNQHFNNRAGLHMNWCWIHSV
jgi:tRNA uridine 5-carbamoylmethylation protein Kti12